MTEQLDEQLDEPAGLQIGEWPAFPPGVGYADGVDVDADDPAVNDSGRRQCVAPKTGGGRCGAAPMRSALLCAVHAGVADSSAGGHARAQKKREQREDAESQVAMARLGTRAVVAAALAEKHAQIRSTIHRLADLGASGDRQAALALIPWINQGLGMPTERHEHTLPGTAAELAELPTADLEAMVAERRRARLHAVEDAAETA